MPQHPAQARSLAAQHPFENAFAGPIQPAVRRCVRSGFSNLAHIIGVVVSETTSETTIATDSVTANSRNSRPTMPPISRMGMNTATSEMLIERTVKPISLAPRKRRLQRRHALFEVSARCSRSRRSHRPRRTGRDRQRHQRQIVETVAEQVHHAERAQQRERHRELGMNVAQQLRRNRNTTRITRPIEISSVNSTSCTDARIVVVRSITTDH